MLNQNFTKATILAALGSQVDFSALTDLHHEAEPYTVGSRQSPINIETTNIDPELVVLDDPEFSINCGSVNFESMKVVNKKSLEFDFEGEDLAYTSSLPYLWYSDLEGPMTFTPKQLHFHMGNGTTSNPYKGSEHEIDGDHFDLEMHIVNLNLNEATQDKFKAAVIGVLF
jgi:carbonic anhydrase